MGRMSSCSANPTPHVPLKDLRDKQAWIAFRFDGGDLAPEHGGPARLLVPHLYFWKSAKWVRGITLLDHDEPGSAGPFQEWPFRLSGSTK